MGTLNGHLQMVHGVPLDEYRERYGLPWRRGLVARAVSIKLSTLLSNRIRNGSFRPKPDNRAAVNAILSGNLRKDPPYVTGSKAERTKTLSKQNVRYGREDYEKVLSVMMKRKISLTEACKKNNLPGSATVLGYAELNPEFRKRLIDTYHSLPYAVQARADMFSPKFYRDLERLKKKGLPATEIGKILGISAKTIRARLKNVSGIKAQTDRARRN